jgi:hypothetical protein
MTTETYTVSKSFSGSVFKCHLENDSLRECAWQEVAKKNDNMMKDKKGKSKTELGVLDNLEVAKRQDILPTERHLIFEPTLGFMIKFEFV